MEDKKRNIDVLCMYIVLKKNQLHFKITIASPSNLFSVFFPRRNEFVCTLLRKQTLHFSLPEFQLPTKKSFSWHFCDQLRR